MAPDILEAFTLLRAKVVEERDDFEEVIQEIVPDIYNAMESLLKSREHKDTVMYEYIGLSALWSKLEYYKQLVARRRSLLGLITKIDDIGRELKTVGIYIEEIKEEIKDDGQG